MRHCCTFRADDIYYLAETNLFVSRKLQIGFCPICKKPVAELIEISFTGAVERCRASGYKSNILVESLKNDIVYSMRECNYIRFKAKPFGWKYGVNKSVRIKGQERIKQYAYDFYGNKEIIKTIIIAVFSSVSIT